MGLARRKVSGKNIGGSRLIVPGQDIFSVKKFQPEFKKNRAFDKNYAEVLIITPTPIPNITPTNTSTPNITPTPTVTPTNTPTPTVTPTPQPSLLGIYYGKFNSTIITSGDVSTFTFMETNNPTEIFVPFQYGLGYFYILIPTTLPQPTQFRDSDDGCSGFNVPINNVGQIIILDGNGFQITYNIYRSFFPSYGSLDIWLCD